LPANQPLVVRFTGANGAPQVRLHGPGGQTIDTPAPGAAGSAQGSGWAAFRQDADRQTDVVLANTGDGKWRYETLPGPGAVTGVKTAAKLPAVNVKAKVEAARGGAEQLTWNLTPIPGQKVTFSEQGAGAPPRDLVTTASKSGNVRFKPFLTPQRKRKIVATV